MKYTFVNIRISFSDVKCSFEIFKLQERRKKKNFLFCWEEFWRSDVCSLEVLQDKYYHPKVHPPEVQGRGFLDPLLYFTQDQKLFIILCLLCPRWALSTTSPISLFVNSSSRGAPSLEGLPASCVRNLRSTHSRIFMYFLLFTVLRFLQSSSKLKSLKKPSPCFFFKAVNSWS